VGVGVADADGVGLADVGDADGVGDAALGAGATVVVPDAGGVTDGLAAGMREAEDVGCDVVSTPSPVHPTTATSTINVPSPREPDAISVVCIAPSSHCRTQP
jgi:hypothetical protein